MRIRVGHVNQPGVDAELLFKHAAVRKLAWVTGTTRGNVGLVEAARELGYETVFAAEDPYWVAVRADLIKEDTWVPNLMGNYVFAAFEPTVAGLGEIIVASGFDVNTEEIGQALDFKLVFSGGKQDDELGFGFYDEDRRIQKLKTSPGANDNYMEALITI